MSRTAAFYRSSKREKLMFRFTPHKIVALNSKGNLLPRSRSGHRMVIYNGNIYVFGGYNPEIERTLMTIDEILFKEMWRFNYASKTWDCLDVSGMMPEEVASHCAVSVDKFMLVYGGTGVPFGHSSSNISHLCDLESMQWFTPETTGSPPLEMYGQAIAISENSTKMYVVGGTTGYIYSMSVHCLDLVTRNWSSLSDLNDSKWQPAPRYRHEIAIYDNQLFVFGGGTAEASFDLKEIPVFKLDTCTWVKVVTSDDCPEPRRCHGLVQVKDDIYICGGYNGIKIFSDVWRLNLISRQWTKLPISLPIPVYFHSVALSERGQLFIFGGVTSFSPAQRTNAIFSVWLRIPSLADMCWDAVLHYMPFIGQVKKENLLEAGVPIHYLNEIEFLDPMSHCCHRLQS